MDKRHTLSARSISVNHEHWCETQSFYLLIRVKPAGAAHKYYIIYNCVESYLIVVVCILIYYSYHTNM